MSTRAPRSINGYLDVFDVRNQHEIEVKASVETTYRSTRNLDVGRSLPITALFAIRALPRLVTGKSRLTRSITLDTLLDAGFVMLEENAPHEIVMGTVGKFWRPDSGMVRISPDEFRSFDEPGFAKGTMTFTVEELNPKTSLLATETRVVCTDSSARRKFLLYWRAIGPFSGLIRRLMLNEVKHTAEGLSLLG